MQVRYKVNPTRGHFNTDALEPSFPPPPPPPPPPLPSLEQTLATFGIFILYYMIN